MCQQLVELVSDYLAGDLRPSERVAIEKHLMQCEHCTDYVEQVRRLLELTSSAVSEQEQLPADLAESVMVHYRELR